MSYLYRRKKRILANSVLRHLNDELIQSIRDKNEKYDTYLNIYQLLINPEGDYSITISVFLMLLDNGHLERSDSKDTQFACITPKGVDAYRCGFYNVENRKDLLESIEVWSKWIIPFVSVTLSIAALIVAILKK